MGDQTDEELMLRYQQGESGAFDTLYDRYARRVFAYLSKRIADASARDDLFQSIFLKLHRSKHLFDGRYLFAPWLFTICRTAVLDHVKTAKTHVEYEDQETPASQEDLLAFREAVSALSPQQREVLEMRYEKGMEFSQIAERLGLGNANVRQLVSRAVRKLRGRT